MQLTVAGIDEARATFGSLIPWLTGGKLVTTANAQFLNWSECLLGKGALTANEEATRQTPYPDSKLVETTQRLFRLWAAHPAVKQGISSHNTSNADTSSPVSRASVWKAYYGFLTAGLHDGLPYTAPMDGPERPQLANELRRVGSICDGNLLREAKFPTASSHNAQIEEWVEQVISNWEILCGPHWSDEDLGEGGQNAIGHSVLDVSAHG